MAHQARRVEPSNADYDTLFAMATTPTFEVDGAGHVVRANPAACRMFEGGPQELAGTLLDEVIGADVTPALGSQTAHDIEATLPHGPETLRLRSFPRTLSSTTGERFTVLLTRATSRRGRDEALRGDVVGWSLMDDLSHNLGTPLSIVAGYSETLRDRGGEMAHEDIRAAAEAIHRNAQRAIHELRALQARARVTAGGAGSLPTSVLLAWLRRILAVPLEANNAVLVGTATSSTITVDVGITRQVLLNLCRAQLESAATAPTIELDVRTTTDGTEFHVSALQELAHDDPMLHATEALVATAGGRFAPASEPGGTHVVWLPDTSTSHRSERPSIPVAVIEDDHDTAALIHASLAATSGMFEVVVDARTFADGVEACATARPRIVLLDQHLPDRLGTEGIRELHDVAPGAIVVVLSRTPATIIDADDRVIWLEKSRVLADLGSELIAVLGAP